jgi:molecular chaperone Hsp33
MNLAHYFRYHWEKPNLIVVTGEAEEIWKGYSTYCERYGILETEPEGTAMLKRLFAAAGLAAVSLPEPEWWGWSVTFKKLSKGLFCGVEPEGSVCGRVLESDPQKNLVVVQRQAKNSPMTQSYFSLITHDPVEAVERYFEEAEQTLIRIAVDRNGRGVLLRPLPGGNFDDIGGLTDDELISRCFKMAEEEKIKRLQEVLLFYECPCNMDQIKKMLNSLPENQLTELWRGLDMLEVSCPRCGRKYIVKRE